MARSRARKTRRKARQKAYNRHLQRHPEGQRTLEEEYPIQADKDQKQDALDFSVSGGHFESNRRRH